MRWSMRLLMLFVLGGRGVGLMVHLLFLWVKLYGWMDVVRFGVVRYV